MRRKIFAAGGGVAAVALAVGLATTQAQQPSPPAATTPIKHVVVLFDENISFDHYFGTYPNARNTPGEPQFHARSGTPSVNGLNDTLLNDNPNSANPKRLSRSEALTCDQDHGYADEQKAADQGLMDRFVEFTAGGSCTDRSIVMDYYDGNTVTGLWNLAQHYSMSDNSYDTVFGPSTPGALNLVSGQTHGATPASGNGVENGSVIGDPDPALDDCGKGGVTMSGKNVGDLLTAHHLTWGWFQGGFRPTSQANGKAVCGASHTNIGGATVTDYSPHHEPFMYYPSTANPHHLPPSSRAAIGQDDQAHHQYDLVDFEHALADGNLPAVSFLKAAEYQDGHPGYSDPLDEQRFIAKYVDAIERSPQWKSTAIVIAYDDSDGWYDHQMGPILQSSAAPSDALNGPGKCGNVKATTPPAYSDRCGLGPRQPLLVISPWAKQNFVDSSLTEQASITKFIEDNWTLGRIGDQSFDERAGTLGNMLDFDPRHARAPKVTIDGDTGLVTSVSGRSRTTHGSRTHRAGGAGVKVRCTGRGAGRRVRVTCKATKRAAGHTALRLRLVRGGRVVASKRVLLRRGRATTSLRSNRRLSTGRYRLRVAVSRRGGVSAYASTLRVG